MMKNNFMTNAWDRSLAHQGNLFVISERFSWSPYTLNSWLISPRFRLPEISSDRGITLAYWHRPGISEEAEVKYDFLISTTDSHPNSFEIKFSEVLTTQGWTEREVDLSEYAGQDIYFAIIHRICDDNPTTLLLDTFSIVIDTVSDDDATVKPLVTGLIGNYPNPFNPYTSIRYQVSGIRPENVEINVYNVRGQKVRTLLDGSRGFEAGIHSVDWDGRDDNGNQMSSGIYFYRMTAGDFRETRRMLLLK